MGLCNPFLGHDGFILYPRYLNFEWVSRQRSSTTASKSRRKKKCSQNTPAVKMQDCRNVALLVGNLTPSSATIATSHKTTTPTAFTPPLALSLLLPLLFFTDKSTLVLQFFLGLLRPHSRPWEVLRPSRVRIRAAFALGAETGEVEQAELSANVSLGAEGAQFTESPIVVLTRR